MWWKKKQQVVAAEFPLSNLDPGGVNYLIQNADTEMSTNRQVITLLSGNRLGVMTWQGEFAGEKMFKIEQCSDYPEDWILTAYNSETQLQWVVNNSTLEARTYPNNSGDERRRPPFKQWRFCFEEVGRAGSKKFLIISKDEDLQGNNCLCLIIPQDAVDTAQRQLGFAAKNENDLSQIWCLHQR
ncbi:hypothetical protein Ocin01_12181 [Orchesella cincta]|uniref:Uncharacterized protein n=1 Tax=Orchesella cincta TaxID=48709 RepID=A0A1D2MNJ0_ORCCI|nr:hypothetical protein Ocin01_12181 [Orchesella cincta]